jgi:hypothetical protein
MRKLSSTPPHPFDSDRFITGVSHAKSNKKYTAQAAYILMLVYVETESEN